MHTHVYRHAINLAVDSDIVGFQNGVTTLLDCGSTGSGTFMGHQSGAGAAAPGRGLSKDAASHVVGRLADDFETWRHHDLAEDQIQYLLMDGWYPRVRIGKRRVRVPVLVTLGVSADGERWWSASAWRAMKVLPRGAT